MQYQQINPLLEQITPEVTGLQKEKLRRQLVEAINHLLVNDFASVVQLLYRVDVSEKKLKQLLKEQPQTDAAVLVVGLLIQRQEEKIKTRNSFPTGNASEDEKW